MIKAVKFRKKDGAPLYIFGLSEENIQRLRRGEAIKFSLDVLGQPGEVFIYYGKTEEQMEKDLKPFIGKDTRKA